MKLILRQCVLQEIILCKGTLYLFTDTRTAFDPPSRRTAAAAGVTSGAPTLCLSLRRHGVDELRVELAFPGGRRAPQQVVHPFAALCATPVSARCQWEGEGAGRIKVREGSSLKEREREREGVR